MAHAIRLDDPYLCSVRRSSAVGDRLFCMWQEDLCQLVAESGIAECTSLSLAQELLLALRRMEHSRYLGNFHIRTRGWLRSPDNVAAGELLSQWEQRTQVEWGQTGIRITVESIPQLHSRNILCIGTSSSVDVNIEWGLSYWSDNGVNWLLAPGPQGEADSALGAVTVRGRPQQTIADAG